MNKKENIVNEVKNNLVGIYRNTSKFIDSGELWSFCMETIGNSRTLSNIVFTNDMGVPPVKSLIALYERKFQPFADFEFTAVESQTMGALMGFVFKFGLDYTAQKERCSVSTLELKQQLSF